MSHLLARIRLPGVELSGPIVSPQPVESLTEFANGVALLAEMLQERPPKSLAAKFARWNLFWSEVLWEPYTGRWRLSASAVQAGPDIFRSHAVLNGVGM